MKNALLAVERQPDRSKGNRARPPPAAFSAKG